ncbi:MAG: DNA polymerase III subunit delta' [Planctomycetaceae bacterium]|nr:DNA polymerase III subunit delta' [Planctomycetaceae bacterium]
MSWHGIEGHDEVVEEFRRALRRGRLASSFLFAGPAGIGKRTFALKLAQAMLCQARPEDALDPCGQCPSCVQAAAGTHPDIAMVAKPADRAFIPLELLIGEREHRRREGLCHEIGLRPYLGGRKIALIDDADYLNAEAANALLKTLEEPPPQSVLILIGTTPAKQLPTIRSRCQLIRFRPLPTEVVSRLLVAKGLVEDGTAADRLAQYSEGSVQRALELSDAGLWTFRNTLYQRLSEPMLDSVRLAQGVATFVDEAGKEASARRARLRQVVAFAADFYRELMRAQCGSALTADRELREHVDRAMQRGPGDRQATLARLDRCLDASAQIDRNANQATLIECWMDDLARGESPVG